MILKTQASLCLRITHCRGARPVQTGSVHSTRKEPPPPYSSLCCLLMFLAVHLASCLHQIFRPSSALSHVALKWSVHLHFSETEMTGHSKNPVPGFLSHDWHYHEDNIIPGSVFVYFRRYQSSRHCSDWRVSAFEKVLFRNSLPQFPFHLFSIFPKAFYFSISGTNMLMEYALLLLFLVHNHELWQTYPLSVIVYSFSLSLMPSNAPSCWLSSSLAFKLLLNHNCGLACWFLLLFLSAKLEESAKNNSDVKISYYSFG